MRSRLTMLTAAIAGGSTCITMAALAGPALASHDTGQVPLIKVSHDPYQGDGAQHATEAEPDTFAWKKTIDEARSSGGAPVRVWFMPHRPGRTGAGTAPPARAERRSATRSRTG